MSFAHKRMGTVGVRPVAKPSGVYADEAKTRQRQRQERIIARREKFVLLNKHRYPNMYEKWLAKGKGKLPNCPVCRDAVIHWNEPAHECPGFKPMFVEVDDAWKEKMEARREAIREAKRDSKIVCSVCGDEIPEYEDAEWHWEDHEGKPEREHHAIDGEPDGDMDGYEDWCDEDESYEEDDGDPDWD